MRRGAFISVSLVLGALAAAADIAWLPNFEAALAQAKETRRDLLVFVGGSDWSAPSRTYKSGVIQSPQVAQALGKEFLWLEIDRPDQATEAQKLTAKKNGDFEVQIRNYPGLALLDPDGRCYFKAEAPLGGVMGLVNAVKQACKLKARRDAELALAEKATGLERARHLGAALDMMGEFAVQNGKQSHHHVLDELKKLDPEDRVGTQRRLTFNPDAFAEGQLWPLVQAKKYAEALALVDRELADPRNNLWLRQHLLGLRFHVFQAQENLGEAVKTLRQIIALDGSTDMARLAQNYVENIAQPVVLTEAAWKPEHLRFYFAEWRLDASRLIAGQGTYEIEFKVLDGERITVRDVAVMAGGKELGKAAMPANSSKVELTVPRFTAGQRVWLKIAAKGQGWFSSRGEIRVMKK